MTYIIGLSSINRDSTTSLISPDGRILAVVAEDRFTRVKQQGGFPHIGMRYILGTFGVRPEAIDSVCYSFLNWEDERHAILESAASDAADSAHGPFDPLGRLLHRRGDDRWNRAAIDHQRRDNSELETGLDR